MPPLEKPRLAPLGGALFACAALALGGCPLGEGSAPDAGSAPADAGVVDDDAGPGPDAGTPTSPIELPAYEQRAGDPDAGYLAMVNEGYIGCGLPETAYDMVFGDAPEELRLPGRTGRNATLPYDQTAFEVENGVTVIAANCLFCHAAPLPGPEGGITLGLGNANLDFTQSSASAAELAGLFLSDADEVAAWSKWKERVVATAPYLITRTRGVNPADNLAGILFAHRDPQTLAWSEEPLLDPPDTDPTPTDVPPWWGMRKKNAMFYTGSGRGDHARIQMTASTLCTDSVEEAQEIDAYFNDVRAWIASLEAPVFPGAVVEFRAATGKALFENHCAHCHGTYGDDGVYLNLLVPLAEVGTDPQLAEGSEHFADRFVDWFNQSFYGEIASLEPGAGYVAPPLDGVWATAPYLHNGSVPDLLSLLDSTRRPTYFARSYVPSEYDLEAVGWPYEAREAGHDELDEGERRGVYDTTQPGYGNQGHTYGDALTEEERDAVLEYLKTL